MAISITQYVNDTTNFDAAVMNVPLLELLAGVNANITDIATNTADIATNTAAIAAMGSIVSKNFWTGTGAEYTALGTYDSDTLYFLTSGV